MQETYLQYDPENPDAYDGDIDADTEEFFEMYMGMGIDAYQEVCFARQSWKSCMMPALKAW